MPPALIPILGCTLPAAAVLVTASTSAAPPILRVEPIGPSMNGFDLAEDGTAVGRQVSAQPVGRAFVARRGGAVEVLPLPAGFQSSDAYAIGSSGIIVGAVSASTIASVGSRPIAWYPSGDGFDAVMLPTIAGDTHGAAFGVNGHGDIVGGSGGLGLGSYPRPVRFTPSGAVLLGEIATPSDVNDDRIVLASNQLLDLDTMVLTTVPLPPGNWQGFVAQDLSAGGNFCGYVLGFSGCSTFPLRHRTDAGWEFVGGCATTTAASSINDRGDCTAYVANTSSWVAYVDDGNINPNTLLDPVDSAWSITSVGTITNGGSMLAMARLGADPVTQLVRLVPVRSPDLDGNGSVDGADLGILLSAWGSGPGTADLNLDGEVDGGDLGALLAGWGG
jgi:hypothetical protein